MIFRVIGTAGYVMGPFLTTASHSQKIWMGKRKNRTKMLFWVSLFDFLISLKKGEPIKHGCCPSWVTRRRRTGFSLRRLPIKTTTAGQLRERKIPKKSKVRTAIGQRKKRSLIYYNGADLWVYSTSPLSLIEVGLFKKKEPAGWTDGRGGRSRVV